MQIFFDTEDKGEALLIVTIDDGGKRTEQEVGHINEDEFCLYVDGLIQSGFNGEARVLPCFGRLPIFKIKIPERNEVYENALRQREKPTATIIP